MMSIARGVELAQCLMRDIECPRNFDLRLEEGRYGLCSGFYGVHERIWFLATL